MSQDDWSQDSWAHEDWSSDDSDQEELTEKIVSELQEMVEEKTPVKKTEAAEKHQEKPPVVAEKPPANNETIPEKKPEKISMNRLVLQGVDSGLDMFGKNVKEIFYAELESAKGIKRSQILDNKELFHGMIEQFFGPGTPLVERSIGRAVLCCFDLPADAGVSFASSLEIIKRNPRVQDKLA
jgi:hypothetical protein